MSSRSSAALIALACSVVLSAQSSTAPVSSRSADQLRHDIDAILGSPVLQHGLWGVVIKPVERDDVWYARNGDTLMMPASSLKVLTLAAAAEKLGWEYRYETKVFAVGTILLYSALPTRPDLILGIVMVSIGANLLINAR